MIHSLRRKFILISIASLAGTSLILYLCKGINIQQTIKYFPPINWGTLSPKPHEVYPIGGVRFIRKTLFFSYL